MSRYFLEMRYLGTRYSGFQRQDNAVTIQSETERALEILLRAHVELTGSSRTDAGVHALQNFFHFDWEGEWLDAYEYNLNALLPEDIAVRSVRRVKEDAHCRFDAISRSYAYHLYRAKDPLMAGRGWYYPYPLDLGRLVRVAEMVLGQEDFEAFSKRNTQVAHYRCRVMESRWEETDYGWVYRVKANRFLRGMVRGLVGTMLLVGRGKIDEGSFAAIMGGGDCRRVDFSAPAQGLFLERVEFGDGV